MRNISFSLTTNQFRDRSKTVTRRIGWKFLKGGESLMACEKCQGLKPGEKVKRLGEIEVVSVRREPLNAIENEPDGATREGFPQMDAGEFVRMFCEHYDDVEPGTTITRIEFRYK